MKRYLLILVGLAVHSVGHAQTSSIKETEWQSEIQRVTAVLEGNEVLDSLVQLAIKNSNLLAALEEDVKIYSEEYLQKKRLWYSSFRLGVNIFSASTTTDAFNESVTTVGLLPNVGLSLTIDPERLVNRKSYMRQSENKRQHAAFIVEDTKQVLKKKLVGEYYQYLTYLETITIRQKLVQNRQEQVQLHSSSFKSGESTYEQIVLANHQVHLAEESLMKAVMDARGKKRELEIFLGIR